MEQGRIVGVRFVQAKPPTAAAELIEQAGKMIRQMKREQMAAAKVQAQS